MTTQSRENIVCNLSGGVRRERVGDRDYLVAPLTMIVPGVLQGNLGPLFYPEDEIAQSAPYWDGVVLTNGHLTMGMNGRSIRVRDEFGIGFVQNPTTHNGRLKAEGWFDVERTRRINPNILNALYAGQRIELSTGLRIEHDKEEGVFNGRHYVGVARRYRPDHLAILTNERGACSLQDGCGVFNCGGHQSPAGGSLGIPTLFREATSNAPTIHRSHAQLRTSRSGPRGGPLGIAVLNFEQQPATPTTRNIEQLWNGPAGGSLGACPPLF